MAKRLLLVDGDMVAFSHAAAEEYGKEPEDVSFPKIQASMDSKMDFMAKRLRATNVITTISGDVNMRHVISPDYKANRDGVWRPDNLKNAKAHLLVAWDGLVMDGLEADDLMAAFARHEYSLKMGKRNKILEMVRVGACQYDEVIIASLDKDLRQVGSQGSDGPRIIHYQWERESLGIGEKRIAVSGFGELNLVIKQSGKTTKKEVKGNGPKFFLWQLLTGDTTDGVMGCGISEKKIYKSGAKAGQEYFKRCGVGALEAYELLQGIDNYAEGLRAVATQYVLRFGDGWAEQLLRNGRLLYMSHHVDKGRYIRLWHYDGKTIDRYDLKEHRIIPHSEYLQL